VELDFISLRLDAGKHGRDLAMLVLDEYKRRLLDLSRCRLDLGLDPLGALALNGRIVNRAELSRRAGEMFTTAKSMDQAGGIFCADTRAYHGAGCSEAQELAIAIATAVDYMRLLEEAGIEPAASAPHISMVMTADADQFLTMAKLRAIRQMWARVLDASGLKQSPLTLHVETAARMMSKRDPHVNMLRVTTAAFAAGVAGADSVTVLPFTHALGLPDGFARRMARNIQTLLARRKPAWPGFGCSGRVGLCRTADGNWLKAGPCSSRSNSAGGMMAWLVDGKASERFRKSLKHATRTSHGERFR
jgi:methylmalonyl-CoA mutase